MRIAVHITFYLDKNKDKVKKLVNFKKIYSNFLKISPQTKIFVHTNKKIKDYKKNLFFIYHNIKNEDPYKLTWKCRNLMEKQKNNFDCFIYSEDDIIFSKKNFNYWLKYKDLFKKYNYNVGFIRTEKLKSYKKLWLVDQLEKLNEYIVIKKKYFFIVKNPYCAMWIYDKSEFNLFVNSKFWDLSKWRGLDSLAKLYDREKSAIGWHSLSMDRYKATIVPVNKQGVVSDCIISHSSNKYVNLLGRLNLSSDNLISHKSTFFKKKKSSKLRLLLNEFKFIFYQSLRFNLKNIKKFLK